MPDASLLGDTLGLSQGLDGCRLQVAHLVTGEETAEMQGRLFETVVLQPLAHSANHLHIIVHAQGSRGSSVRSTRQHHAWRGWSAARVRDVRH